MHKTLKQFRLSDEHIAVLQKHMTDHSLPNMTEALERILSAEILSPQTASPLAASGASDLFPCNQRLELKGQLYCVVPASLSRIPKIGDTSIEVCNICQSIRKNLPANAKMTQPKGFLEDERAPATTPGESFERNRDPSNSNRKNAGMLWCPEGLWVFPNKCETCKTRNFAVWFDCQKQKYRQKGKEVTS